MIDVNCHETGYQGVAAGLKYVAPRNSSCNASTYNHRATTSFRLLIPHISDNPRIATFWCVFTTNDSGLDHRHVVGSAARNVVVVVPHRPLIGMRSMAITDSDDTRDEQQ